MKKLLLTIACVGFMASAMFAQTAAGTTSTGTKATTTAAPAKYICPGCGAVSNAPGKCAKCNKALVKEGMYYCPGCGATSTKPGKCAKCNMDMKKMTASTK